MSVRIEYGPYRQPRLSEKLKRAVSQEDLGTRSRHESCVREVLDDLGFWKPMKNMSTAEWLSPGFVDIPEAWYAQEE